MIKKIVLLFVFVFLISLISATIGGEIVIKKSFTVNEEIYFNYTLISGEDKLFGYIPYIDCPNLPRPLIERKTINLIANQPYESVYYDVVLDDSVESQICVAYIQILEPGGRKIEETFQINTTPSYNFNIILNKKIYMKEEKIKINYDSEISKPSIITTLTYPDKTIEQIKLPYSFKSQQIGTYELEVTASKEGYKTITKREQFGVIGVDDFDTEPGFFQKILNWFDNLFGGS